MSTHDDPQDRAQYDDVRTAFERLKTQDKTAFVLEATFSTIGQALAETGRGLADLFEKAASEDFFSGRRPGGATPPPMSPSPGAAEPTPSPMPGPSGYPDDIGGSPSATPRTPRAPRTPRTPFEGEGEGPAPGIDL